MNDFKKNLDKKLKDPARKAKWGPSAPEYQLIQALLSARKRKNITQKQLAEATGITQPDISRLENGRGNPSLRTLNTLAKGLGMRLKIEFINTGKRPTKPSVAKSPRPKKSTAKRAAGNKPKAKAKK